MRGAAILPHDTLKDVSRQTGALGPRRTGSFASVLALALRGAHVIGTGRTLEKATAACAGVVGRTRPLALELTDFPSVVACASAVQALGVPLDILVCNAGIMALPNLEQVYGLEKQFVTNHRGHFLLVNHLLAQEQSAPQVRVVFVSTSALKWDAATQIEAFLRGGIKGQFHLANQPDHPLGFDTLNGTLPVLG